MLPGCCLASNAEAVRCKRIFIELRRVRVPEFAHGVEPFGGFWVGILLILKLLPNPGTPTTPLSRYRVPRSCRIFHDHCNRASSRAAVDVACIRILNTDLSYNYPGTSQMGNSGVLPQPPDTQGILGCC